MTQVIVDEAMLREPNLWVPGNPPIGVVKPDYSHPMSNGFDENTLFSLGQGAVSLSAGGSGYTKNYITQGKRGIYIPNGGYLDASVNNDWSGPITVGLHCVIHSIDNPWGGLITKISSGTYHQFAIGRSLSTDNLYASVVESQTLAISGTSISSYIGAECVFCFYWGGSTSPPAYDTIGMVKDGKYVGTTSSTSTAQPAGTGALALGRSRVTDLAYDSSVTVFSCFRWNRKFSKDEAICWSLDPYQFLIPA